MEILTNVKRLYLSFKSLVNDFVYSFGRVALLLLVEVQNHTVPVRERGRIRVNASVVFIYRRKEQKANPGAAIQAIKYYNYSIKKRQSGTFKPLVTEEAIKEESEEIEKILGIYIKIFFFFLHAIRPCVVYVCVTMHHFSTMM